MTSVGYFDADGVCTKVVSGIDEPGEGEIVVPDGSGPKDVWLNPATGEVEASVPMAVPLPLNPTAPFTIDLPDGVIAEVKGVRHRDSVTIDHLETVAINLMGAAHGHAIYKNYARRRQDIYPPLGDQLDAIWKALDPEPGSEAAQMKAAINSVKLQIPKP